MTTQERFNKVMHWQEPDQVPNMDFGYWEETITIWHKQGLPTYVKTNQDVERYLGLEGVEIIPSLPVANGLYPPFDYKVLEDKGQHINVQELAVEAVLKKDKKAAIQAIMLDPLTSSHLTLDKIRKMVQEVFEAEREYLPDFK